MCFSGAVIRTFAARILAATASMPARCHSHVQARSMEATIDIIHGISMKQRTGEGLQ